MISPKIKRFLMSINKLKHSTTETASSVIYTSNICIITSVRNKNPALGMRSLLHSPSPLLFFCPSVCLSLQRWNACFLSQLWWTLLWINIQCELSHAQNCSKCNLSLSNSLWSEDSPPWYIAADPFSEPLLQLITCAIPGSLQDIFPFVEHWTLKALRRHTPY